MDSSMSSRFAGGLLYRDTIIVYWSYIGIRENKMETTIGFAGVKPWRKTN